MVSIWEKPYGSRQDRGCRDQVFVARQVCEKYLASGNDEFWAFVEFYKAYDMIDRNGK